MRFLIIKTFLCLSYLWCVGSSIWGLLAIKQDDFNESTSKALNCKDVYVFLCTYLSCAGIGMILVGVAFALIRDSLWKWRCLICSLYLPLSLAVLWGGTVEFHLTLYEKEEMFRETFKHVDFYVKTMIIVSSVVLSTHIGITVEARKQTES
jgi:hypothetical protein